MIVKVVTTADIDQELNNLQNQENIAQQYASQNYQTRRYNAGYNVPQVNKGIENQKNQANQFISSAEAQKLNLANLRGQVVQQNYDQDTSNAIIDKLNSSGDSSQARQSVRNSSLSPDIKQQLLDEIGNYESSVVSQGITLKKQAVTTVQNEVAKQGFVGYDTPEGAVIYDTDLTGKRIAVKITPDVSSRIENGKVVSTINFNQSPLENPLLKNAFNLPDNISVNNPSHPDYFKPIEQLSIPQKIYAKIGFDKPIISTGFEEFNRVSGINSVSLGVGKVADYLGTHPNFDKVIQPQPAYTNRPGTYTDNVIEGSLQEFYRFSGLKAINTGLKSEPVKFTEDVFSDIGKSTTPGNIDILIAGGLAIEALPALAPIAGGLIGGYSATQVFDPSLTPVQRTSAGVIGVLGVYGGFAGKPTEAFDIEGIKPKGKISTFFDNFDKIDNYDLANRPELTSYNVAGNTRADFFQAPKIQFVDELPKLGEDYSYLAPKEGSGRVDIFTNGIKPNKEDLQVKFGSLSDIQKTSFDNFLAQSKVESSLPFQFGSIDIAKENFESDISFRSGIDSLPRKEITSIDLSKLPGPRFEDTPLNQKLRLQYDIDQLLKEKVKKGQFQDTGNGFDIRKEFIISGESIPEQEKISGRVPKFIDESLENYRLNKIQAKNTANLIKNDEEIFGLKLVDIGAAKSLKEQGFSIQIDKGFKETEVAIDGTNLKKSNSGLVPRFKEEALGNAYRFKNEAKFNVNNLRTEKELFGLNLKDLVRKKQGYTAEIDNGFQGIDTNTKSNDGDISVVDLTRTNKPKRVKSFKTINDFITPKDEGNFKQFGSSGQVQLLDIEKPIKKSTKPTAPFLTADALKNLEQFERQAKSKSNPLGEKSIFVGEPNLDKSNLNKGKLRKTNIPQDFERSNFPSRSNSAELDFTREFANERPQNPTRAKYIFDFPLDRSNQNSFPAIKNNEKFAQSPRDIFKFDQPQPQGFAQAFRLSFGQKQIDRLNFRIDQIQISREERKGFGFPFFGRQTKGTRSRSGYGKEDIAIVEGFDAKILGIKRKISRKNINSIIAIDQSGLNIRGTPIFVDNMFKKKRRKKR